MFRIKICGITRTDDAKAAVDAGADAIGLNFYEPSPRSVSAKQALQIIKVLPADVVKVGVFVNHSVDEMLNLRSQLKLDYLQLHGDESPEVSRQIGPQVIRAFRCRDQGLDQVSDYLSQCEARGCRLAGVLIDSHSPAQYGGTGKVVDWNMLQDWSSTSIGLPLILAGGLKEVNVADAIRLVRPIGVDTASGVESSPGVKDHDLMQRFVAAANKAFDSI